MEATDRDHMTAALRLARRALGRTWPNPAVGCVLAKNGRVVGRGRTADGGRPHAEAEALAMAGDEARGATAYVTLEPCSHYGKTPPCSDALISAGVTRAVVSMTDPDPRVNGQGIAKLKAAGVVVDVGLMEKEAAWLNAGFVMRVTQGRPLVTMKVASSADGRIATARGESRWISGPAARARTHLMRAETDAVLIGSGAGLADDPELTCRLPGLERRSPVRILIDGRLRVPLTSKLAVTARKTPTWIFTRSDVDQDRAEAFRDSGVEIIETEIDANGKIDIEKMFRELGRRGLTNILAEPGGHLAAALLRHDLVDRLVWIHAPLIIGGDGLASSMPFGVQHLKQAPRFRLEEAGTLGEDVYEIMARE